MPLQPPPFGPPFSLGWQSLPSPASSLQTRYLLNPVNPACPVPCKENGILVACLLWNFPLHTFPFCRRVFFAVLPASCKGRSVNGEEPPSYVFPSPPFGPLLYSVFLPTSFTWPYDLPVSPSRSASKAFLSLVRLDSSFFALYGVRKLTSALIAYTD